jgi:murein DD-endopeptidase MepM/ murein hydrolase activator NlpD
LSLNYTEDIVAPASRHRGHSFLRFRRRYLAFGAMAFAGVMTTMPTLPASAEIIHDEEVVASIQHLRTAFAVAPPAVARGEFAISYYSIVQEPVAPGTRLGKRFNAGHQGVDFLPGLGTPVLAIADGVVTQIGEPSGALGVHVVIQHTIDGETVFSTYSHMGLGTMHLALGQVVTRGEVVGNVGSTGESTGPHLHFQILDAGGTPINPLTWLDQHVNI